MSSDQVVLKKPNLLQSIALGGASCVFTVNFTHPIGMFSLRDKKSRGQMGERGILMIGRILSDMVELILAFLAYFLPFLPFSLFSLT